jgi:Type I phosphodiesterase / nucleotide pyrophosphatase
MPQKRSLVALLLGLGVCTAPPALGQHACRDQKPKSKHNVIIFVADGLRRGSVNKYDSPTLEALRKMGVDFPNSHALYPTFTTANASAFATGHGLGDTGDFSNYIWTGQPMPRPPDAGSVTPFLEDDRVLRDLYSQNAYLQEKTLLDVAYANGFNTATIGKLGPTAIQSIGQLRSPNETFQIPATIVFDDWTGRIEDSKSKLPKGVPLSEHVLANLRKAGILPIAPDRSNGMANTIADNGYPGTFAVSGTRVANLNQEKYFADVAHVVIEDFRRDFFKCGRPFVLVFWSRDPDGTQHNQGDSPNSLDPGINGSTSKSAVTNADRLFSEIQNSLKDSGLTDYTDIFVVADHGFSTIAKNPRDIPLNEGQRFYSPKASGYYKYDNKEKKVMQDVKEGYFPPGFLAIELERFLERKKLLDGNNKNLFDPDCLSGSHDCNGSSSDRYKWVDSDLRETDLENTTDIFGEMHPSNGNGLIGGDGTTAGKYALVVTANGGSDLIYAGSEEGKSWIPTVCDFLASQAYVDGLFVDDEYGSIPGTVPLSKISLIGAAKQRGLPEPAIVVNFKNFSLVPGDLLTRVEIADTTLQQGQGMHGSFSRADTGNFMAAIGPDFRSGYVDPLPVSNEDVAITVAKLLGLEAGMSPGGGRVLKEAQFHEPLLWFLPQNRTAFSVKPDLLFSNAPSSSGRWTVVFYQDLDGHRYYDNACFATVKPEGAGRSPCD